MVEVLNAGVSQTSGTQENAFKLKPGETVKWGGHFSWTSTCWGAECLKNRLSDTLNGVYSGICCLTCLLMRPEVGLLASNGGLRLDVGCIEALTAQERDSLDLCMLRWHRASTKKITKGVRYGHSADIFMAKRRLADRSELQRRQSEQPKSLTSISLKHTRCETIENVTAPEVPHAASPTVQKESAHAALLNETMRSSTKTGCAGRTLGAQLPTESESANARASSTPALAPKCVDYPIGYRGGKSSRGKEGKQPLPAQLLRGAAADSSSAAATAELPTSPCSSRAQMEPKPVLKLLPPTPGSPRAPHVSSQKTQIKSFGTQEAPNAIPKAGLQDLGWNDTAEHGASGADDPERKSRPETESTLGIENGSGMQALICVPPSKRSKRTCTVIAELTRCPMPVGKSRRKSGVVEPKHMKSSLKTNL